MDQLYEVMYMYNVTGAVQGESVFIHAQDEEEAKYVAKKLHDYFHRPSKYDLRFTNASVVESGEGITREQWSSVVNINKPDGGKEE